MEPAFLRRRLPAQVEKETPSGDHLDGARVDRDPAVLALPARTIPRHHHARPQVQFRHGVAEDGHFPLAGARVRQGLAYLDQQARTVAPPGHEIDFAAGPGLVVADLGGDAAERGERQVFEQMAGVDQDAGGDRPDERVIDAVDLLRVRVARCASPGPRRTPSRARPGSSMVLIRLES